MSAIKLTIYYQTKPGIILLWRGDWAKDWFVMLTRPNNSSPWPSLQNV
jgi:hypothetical protein